MVPLTSNVERVYPSEAPVTSKGKPAKAMADRLTTVAKTRLVGLAGRLPPSELQRVEHAVMVQLGLRNRA